MRIPLLRGREFRESDNAKATPVLVVSESFARKYFANEDPIGKHITPGLSDGFVKEVPREIVGVVGDVKSAGLQKESSPEYYFPLAQAVIMSPRVVIRTASDPTILIPQLRAQVAEIDKNLPLYEVKTFDEVVSRSVRPASLPSSLVDLLRRHRSSSFGRGIVRIALVPGGAADPRNRRAHRFGRAARQCARACSCAKA